MNNGQKSRTPAAENADGDRGFAAALPCSVAPAALPGIILGFAADGRLLFANDDSRRFLGLPGSFSGRGTDAAVFHLQDFLHPDDHDAFVSAVGLIRQRPGDRRTVSLHLRSNTGDWRRIEGPLSLDEGSFGQQFLFVGVDFSRHDREKAQFRTLIEGSGQGIAVHRGGRLLFCNQALADMMGLENAEALMAEPSIMPFIYHEDLPLVMANIKARLGGEEVARDYHLRLLSRTGEVIWIDCRASLVHWDGAPAIVASFYNINDRVRAIEARRQSEYLFSRIFDTSLDFISLSRLEDGVFIKVNRAFVEFFGYDEDEVIGRSSGDIAIWNGGVERQVVIDRLRRGESVQDTEVIGMSRSGQRRHFRISAAIIRFETEDLLLIIGRDVSDRKKQEIELLASKEAADLANRAKSEFLANMSHELRTPLNAILGFSEIIQNQIHGPLNEPKYAEYAGDIHDSGLHLLSIINDILDLSKVEAGKLEIHNGEIDFSELAGACLRLITPRAEEAGIRVLADLPDDLPDLFADERLIKQVLLNLLSNAVKFTPAGGELQVMASCGADRIFRFSVSDNGIGMDRDGLARALQPFGQVDSSLSRKHQGSGLGLPLVMAFVERQGGRFDIDSEIGRGTRITIAFPPSRVRFSK